MSIVDLSFKPNGRINCLTFFVSSIVVLMIAEAFMFYPMYSMSQHIHGAPLNNPLIVILTIPAVTVLLSYAIILPIRRLHDIGYSGWCVLLLLVPIVSLVIALALIFWPGEPIDNKYGPALLAPLPKAKQ
jgi:uncharacterized membrane protein YhaH (DUF805 family)